MVTALSSCANTKLFLFPSQLSYPILIPRVPTKPRSVQAIRFSWTYINPTVHNDQQFLHHHFKLPLQLASASVVLFLGFGVRICLVVPHSSLSLPLSLTKTNCLIKTQNKKRMRNWSKDLRIGNRTFALTVPWRVVSLQNSLPQSWVKDFIRS